MRVKVRPSELLSDVWKDRWRKSPPKKLRQRTHSSVFRILEARQLRLKEEQRGAALA